jgi:hypothetical protein
MGSGSGQAWYGGETERLNLPVLKTDCRGLLVTRRIALWQITPWVEATSSLLDTSSQSLFY